MAEPTPKTPDENKVKEELKQAPVEAADTVRESAEALETSAPVQAFAEVRETLAEAIERAAPAPEVDPHGGPTHYVSSTTVIRGRVIPLPVYTVVFIVLAALTVFEIVLAEVFPRGGLTTPVLLLSSLAKAALVVWFYMHLNTDSRVFALTLLLPILMVLLATGFLLMVPMGY